MRVDLEPMSELVCHSSQMNVATEAEKSTPVNALQMRSHNIGAEATHAIINLTAVTQNLDKMHAR